jgi:Ca-activated chloride channel family protein
MRWGDPIFLKLLPGLIVLMILAAIGAAQAARRARRLADDALFPRVAPVVPRWRRMLVMALPLLALAASLLGAARPQLGSRKVQVKRSGVDLVMALDTSASMDAADVVPNRLARARREMIDLIDQLRGDRVGIVVFEGTAFMLCPLTLDYGAARLFLDVIETGMLPVPGSNLTAAIRAAVKSFPSEGTRTRVMVILSDGEARDPQLGDALREAKEAGVTIHTIGVGTPAGEPIPERHEDGSVAGYKKDRSGEVVLSKLDESTLRDIASATGGDYFPATLAGTEVEAIVRRLEGMDQQEMEAGLRTQYEERFQFFAGLGILFLLGSFVLPSGGRRKEWRGRF